MSKECQEKKRYVRGKKGIVSEKKDREKEIVKEPMLDSRGLPVSDCLHWFLVKPRPLHQLCKSCMSRIRCVAVCASHARSLWRLQEARIVVVIHGVSTSRRWHKHIDSFRTVYSPCTWTALLVLGLDMRRYSAGTPRARAARRMNAFRFWRRCLVRIVIRVSCPNSRRRRVCR